MHASARLSLLSAIDMQSMAGSEEEKKQSFSLSKHGPHRLLLLLQPEAHLS